MQTYSRVEQDTTQSEDGFGKGFEMAGTMPFQDAKHRPARLDRVIPAFVLEKLINLRSALEVTPTPLRHGRFFTGSQSEFLRTAGLAFVGIAAPAASITR